MSLELMPRCEWSECLVKKNTLSNYTDTLVHMMASGKIYGGLVEFLTL